MGRRAHTNLKDFCDKNERFPLIGTLIHYFRTFYGYYGNKLLILCLIIFIGSSLEGFGLSLLFPILSYDQPAAMNNAYIRVIYQFYDWMGVEVSLFSLLALAFFVFVCKGLLMFWQGAMRTRISTDMVKNLSLQFCQKYADMKYPYYIDKEIGFLNNLITTELEASVAGFGKFTEVIVTGVSIIIYLTAAFLINWKVTLLVIGICGIFYVLLRGIWHTAGRLSIEVSEKNAQIQSLLIQMIYNFKYMKATNSFAALYKQLLKRFEDRRKSQFKNIVLGFIPSSMLEPVAIFFLSGLILYYVVYRGIPMSEIIILLMFFYRSFSRLFGFQVAWHKFCSCIGGVKVLEKMTVELEQNKEATGGNLPKDFHHDLALRNVSFWYGPRQVLSNINISVPANKTIALIGESGCGKTTILDIMTGLLVPGGEVLVSGQNYTAFDKAFLRSKMGYVTQEPVIFNDTIANNISFWSEKYPPEECRRRVEEAAALAFCTDFIQKNEKGYQSIIGDKGVKLSVGQRQRIAIARELFRDPLIMIFDEATSALDTESEMLIQQSIRSMLGKRTMIIVAHRLSTVKVCDYIYVLSDGKIVEEGKFNDLYNKEFGIFRQKCLLQNI